MVTILSNLSKSTFVHNKITNAILEAIALPIQDEFAKKNGMERFLKMARQ